MAHRTGSSATSGQRITELLEKCSHYDKDERYMATNDLCSELTKGLAMDEPLEQRICTAILKQLDDQSNDVQSVAVKCLGILFKRIHLVQMEKISDKLCIHLLQGNDSLRDIYAIGLKTLISDVPEEFGANVSERMTGQLLGGISSAKSSVEARRECIDILAELLKRFGRFVQGEHERIMNVLLPQLNETKPIVQKRTSICLGSLSVVLSDELLNLLVRIILQQLDKAENERRVPTYIHTIGTISRAVGRRLRSHLETMIPLLLRFCGDPERGLEESEEFEMTENCFAGVESFIVSCHPRDISPHLSSILKVAISFVSYDPNFCYADDEDGGDEMDIDGDDDYGDYGDMDEDLGAEDDDHSWKVRKAAIRVISAIIRHGQLVDESTLVGLSDRSNGNRSIGDLLIARFRERVDNVRFDVLECFNTLVKRYSCRSGENVADSGGDMEIIEDTTSSFPQRVADLKEESLAVKFFGSRIDAIMKNCITLCSPTKVKSTNNTDDVKTRVLALGVVRIIAETMQGQVNLLVPELFEALLLCIKDSQQSVKLEAVVCLRFLFLSQAETARPLLQQRIPTYLSAAQLLTCEDWYKLTIEGLRLFSVFISVLRPVVQTTDDRVTEYDTNCALPASDLNELVLAIFSSVLPQVSSQDNDQEVRECSISVLGSLLAHFGDILLKDSGRSNDTFSLLLKRVDNETTRIPAMRTLIKVARSTISSPFASCSDIIVNTMYGTVSKLLGQQDRTLRQTALRLLDALVCLPSPSSTNSIAGCIYTDLVPELVTLLTDSDLFMCNLAISVARNIIVRHLPAHSDISETVYMTLLNQCVTLVATTQLPDNTVGELKVLLSELAKGGHNCKAMTSLVSIVHQLMYCALEVKARGTSLGSSVSEAGTGSTRGTMINCASCVAGVVLAANEAKVASELSPSVLLVRMQGLVSSNSDVVVGELLEKGSAVNGKDLEEACKQFALLVIGCIGASFDVSLLSVGSSSGTAVCSLLCDLAFQQLDSSSEQIRFAASYCIGNLSVGNSTSCLPLLISAITANLVLDVTPGDNQAQIQLRTQRLLLSALKIVITSRKVFNSDDSFIESIMNPCLVANCASCDESIRSLVADCFGVLMETQWEHIILILLSIINREGPLASALGSEPIYFRALWTVATALKEGLSHAAPEAAGYLCSCSEVTGAFFKVLFDTQESFDLDVRRASLLMLNTLISHNKGVVTPFLATNSCVYLALKDSLLFKKVYKVDLGPYKHEVDDGIPIRKSALTCLETMLLVIPECFRSSELIEGLLTRLTDKDGMIKLQTYQVLSRVLSLDHLAFSLCEIEKLVKPLEKVIFNDAALGKGDAKATGDNNVRPLELTRGALRVVLSVNNESLVSASPAQMSSWAAFTSKIMAVPEVVHIVDQIRLDIGK